MGKPDDRGFRRSGRPAPAYATNPKSAAKRHLTFSGTSDPTTLLNAAAPPSLYRVPPLGGNGYVGWPPMGDGVGIGSATGWPDDMRIGAVGDDGGGKLAG